MPVLPALPGAAALSREREPHYISDARPWRQPRYSRNAPGGAVARAEVRDPLCTPRIRAGIAMQHKAGRYDGDSPGPARSPAERQAYCPSAMWTLDGSRRRRDRNRLSRRGRSSDSATLARPDHIEVQDVSSRRLAVRDGRAELTFKVRARQHIWREGAGPLRECRGLSRHNGLNVADNGVRPQAQPQAGETTCVCMERPDYSTFEFSREFM